MHDTRSSTRAGFSLIEVLIAVVVLAFGLLGLAAVFPAVVKQQTTAKDSVQGVSVLRSAEEWILGHAQLNDHQTEAARALNLQTIANRRGWETLLSDTNWHSGVSGTAPEPIWPPLEIRADVRTGSAAAVIYGQNSGELAIGRPVLNGGVTERGVVIPMSARLFPSPYADPNAKPEYVWDFVARRVDVGLPHSYTGGTPEQERNKYEDDAVELVIFVRRIDPGIRVNRTGNYPLAFALADAILPPPSGVGTPAKLALSERVDGTPTLDGAGVNDGGRYSTPKRAEVSFPEPTKLDTITLAVLSGDPQGEVVTYARQLGQALVDSLGTVHRVRDVQTKNPQNPGDTNWVPRLVVEPAFDPRVRDWPAQGLGTAQVVFTTQVPAAVGVLRIDPRKGGRL